SPAVSAGGTIQISAANIETQSVPAITPVLGQPYDVLVSGPITGYVQHMGFNATSGVITDLSSFRNGGATAP
ncbi:MAG: hypothetical protein SFV21_04395, partial [Rhodospirillaceae bacterium]|nr:hypothetical protein [Rhodospirillaceae bacterium]